MTQTVSFSFFRFESVSARLWAFAMMGFARPVLAGTNGLEFWKLFGAGSGEGFSPRPNLSVCAMLGVWPNADMAQKFLHESWLIEQYRRRAVEMYTLYLCAFSVRGQWSRRVPFEASMDAPHGPIASLTRATVRPSNMRAFWRQEPAISQRIGTNQEVLFKQGLGEVPLAQQMTFSIWPSLDAMHSFANGSGAHHEAICAVRQGGWFKEELYARFAITGSCGTWQGHNPLNMQEQQ